MKYKFILILLLILIVTNLYAISTSYKRPYRDWLYDNGQEVQLIWGRLIETIANETVLIQANS